MDKSSLNPILLTGLFALLGTVAGGIVKGYWDDDLAQRKFYSDLVLKALESPDATARLQTLRMLTQTHLLDNKEIEQGVAAYIQSNAATPQQIPQVLSNEAPPALAPPLTANARIYLLTGNSTKKALLDTLAIPLSKAGFNIMNSKYLNDPGRPATAEIRYFYSEDYDQAKRLASFFRVKLHQPNLTVTGFPGQKYGVTSPGYIEIWTGR